MPCTVVHVVVRVVSWWFHQSFAAGACKHRDALWTTTTLRRRDGACSWAELWLVHVQVCRAVT